MIGGLRDTPEDPRDFQTGQLIILPKLATLPAKYALDTLGIKNQRETDFCTAFASCTVSEMQEGVELSPEYLFAVSKELSGDPDVWGQDIRQAMKAHCKVGTIKKKDAPYSLENKPDTFLRLISNWPSELKQKALEHKKKSYLKITGPYDHYDNIRATIWYFLKERRGIVSGVLWQWPLEQFFLDQPTDNGSGHCIAYIGWENRGLYLQNSYGEEVGLFGRHIVTRETVNKFVQRYGAYMMIDLSPEEVIKMIEQGVKLDDGIWTKWIKAFFSFITNYLKEIWQ